MILIYKILDEQADNSSKETDNTSKKDNENKDKKKKSKINNHNYIFGTKNIQLKKINIARLQKIYRPVL